jgi:hypothetical protein
MTITVLQDALMHLRGHHREMQDELINLEGYQGNAGWTYNFTWTSG